jgi:CDP-paratose synthetase
MKLLISGATGFIGGNLTKSLLNDDHCIHAIIRQSSNVNISHNKLSYYWFDGNIPNLIQYIKNEHFDGIIHLASLFLTQHEPIIIEQLINSNITFATILLEAAIQSNINWFINTGTFWQHYNNQKYSPVNLYSATKEAFEKIAQYYIETSNIKFVTVKLNDTYGPNDTRNKIFNLWIKHAKNEESLDMTEGNQIIDTVYIDDVVDAFKKLINLLQSTSGFKYNGKSFVIKADHRMSLKELSEIFQKITSTTLKINWGKRPYKIREVMIPWEGGIKIPGWKQKISIEEGIKKLFKNEAK